MPQLRPSASTGFAARSTCPTRSAAYLTVAEIRAAQGRLRDALAAYDDGTRSPARPPDVPARGVADVLVGLAARSRSNAATSSTARTRLDEARALGEALGLLRYPYRSRLVAAMLAEAEGDVAGALDLVREAERVYLGDFSPDVRPLHAMAVRLQLRLGDLDAAERWVRDHGLDAARCAVVPARVRARDPRRGAARPLPP